MTDFQPSQSEKRNAVGSEAIDALTKIVAGIKGSGHLYMATFNELHGLGIIENQWIPQLQTRLLVIVDEAESFLAEHGCGIAGPHPGEDDMGGSYYMIDLLRRPPKWPYSVMVSMASGELAQAERGYSAWLDARGATFSIYSIPEIGCIRARLKDRNTAKDFVKAHGGSILTDRQIGDLLYGGEKPLIDASFIERSRRREACATSTATPAT
ncbi:hypothetical protein ACQKLX_07235 [Bosea sp. NPDC003192]|uniref:hypothetical protein n=1 Tax=Bosea sp. NPDC003192 TaxID=3390551 RepID=UPI003D04854C